MKALTWHGKHDVRYETVPDPTIQDGRDAIVKVTACAICGSDLHIFDGLIPSMRVVCSGFQTIGAGDTAVVADARLDALGDGCATLTPRIAMAMENALAHAKSYKTLFNSDGSVTARMSLDLNDFWGDLKTLP